MPPSDPPAESDLQRLVTSGALSAARSPIYLWLWRNHAALLPKLDGNRVRWTTFAASLAAMGVLDANGRPPQAGAVRRSWWRVRKDKEAARAKVVRPPAPPAPPPVPPSGGNPPGLRLVEPPALPPPVLDEPSLDEPRPPPKQRLSLKPAKPRLPPTEGA